MSVPVQASSCGALAYLGWSRPGRFGEEPSAGFKGHREEPRRASNHLPQHFYTAETLGKRMNSRPYRRIEAGFSRLVSCCRHATARWVRFMRGSSCSQGEVSCGSGAGWSSTNRVDKVRSRHLSKVIQQRSSGSY